jgi:hypothetical protein
MRIKEIIQEVKMSQSSLSKMAGQINAIAGVEFEMYVPGVEFGDDEDLELDLRKDAPLESIQQIIDFFSEGDRNNQQAIDRLENTLTHRYEEYFLNELVKEWQPSRSTADFDEVSKEYRRKYYDEKMTEWFDSVGLNVLSDIPSNYIIKWPYVKNEFPKSLLQLQYEFEDVVFNQVKVSNTYHGVKRDGISYIIEPDSSLDDTYDYTGVEFVSPPLPLKQMLSDMRAIISWANSKGCHTDKSCGLHMNISIEGVDHSKLDYIKLAMFVGDEYVLEQFGRIGNFNTKSVLDKLDSVLMIAPQSAYPVMKKMKKSLSDIATKSVHNGITDHYDGLNVHDKYVEFRYAGNDWLNMDIDELARVLMRYIVAYDIACDPTKYQKEYATKLYKFLDKTGTIESIRLLSLYSAGLNPFTRTNIQRKLAEIPHKWEVSIDLNVHDINQQRKATMHELFKDHAPLVINAETAPQALQFAKDKWNISSDRNEYPNFYFKVHEVK